MHDTVAARLLVQPVLAAQLGACLAGVQAGEAGAEHHEAAVRQVARTPVQPVHVITVQAAGAARPEAADAHVIEDAEEPGFEECGGDLGWL